MKAYVDHSLIQILTATEKKGSINLSSLTSVSKIIMGWPCLLEYLGLGDLLKNFPLFNPENELYTFILSLLPLESEQKLLIRAYDQIFVQCLTYIKALPQIHPTFLLEKIERKQQASSQVLSENPFAKSLDHYKEGLSKDPGHLMHDLILYLAWDRVCINLAILFEHSSSNVNIRPGLNLLKECLIESFQHITDQGRTTPSFFRLMETLYAYEMREENLDTHTEAEWLILCQSVSALKSRDKLPDISFIDAAIVDERLLKKIEEAKDLFMFFTAETMDKVKTSLSLAHYTIDKLKRTIPEWHFTLLAAEVICNNFHV